MLRGKISIDLCVEREGPGYDDLAGATLRPEPEDVRFACDVAATALDQLRDDVEKMIEVVKICWRERYKTILVPCFEVIMVEPIINPYQIIDYSHNKRDPVKFKAFVPRREAAGRQELIDLFKTSVEKAVKDQADFHGGLKESLEGRLGQITKA